MMQYQAAIQEEEDPAFSEEGQGTQNYKGCREIVMHHIRMCGLAVCGCVGVWVCGCVGVSVKKTSNLCTYYLNFVFTHLVIWHQLDRHRINNKKIDSKRLIEICVYAIRTCRPINKWNFHKSKFRTYH